MFILCQLCVTSCCGVLFAGTMVSPDMCLNHGETIQFLVPYRCVGYFHQRQLWFRFCASSYAALLSFIWFIWHRTLWWSVAVSVCDVGGRQRRVKSSTLMCFALCVANLDRGAVMRGWIRLRISCGDVQRAQSMRLIVYTCISEEVWWVLVEQWRCGASGKVSAVEQIWQAMNVASSWSMGTWITKLSVRHGDCSFLSISSDGTRRRAAASLL